MAKLLRFLAFLLTVPFTTHTAVVAAADFPYDYNPLSAPKDIWEGRWSLNDPTWPKDAPALSLVFDHLDSLVGEARTAGLPLSNLRSLGCTPGITKEWYAVTLIVGKKSAISYLGCHNSRTGVFVMMRENFSQVVTFTLQQTSKGKKFKGFSGALGAPPSPISGKRKDAYPRSVGARLTVGGSFHRSSFFFTENNGMIIVGRGNFVAEPTKKNLPELKASGRPPKIKFLSPYGEELVFEATKASLFSANEVALYGGKILKDKGIDCINEPDLLIRRYPGNRADIHLTCDKKGALLHIIVSTSGYSSDEVQLNFSMRAASIFATPK